MSNDATPPSYSVDVEARSQIGIIREQISGLGQTVTHLSNQFATFTNDFQSKQSTPWATLTGFAAFILSVVVYGGSLAKAPIDDKLTRLDRDQDRIAIVIEKLADRSISAKEYAAGVERRNDQQRYVEARMMRIERDLDEIQKAIVPRGEHEGHWREVDQLKSALGSTYSLRDAIQKMEREIEQLKGDARSPRS